jgi:hypothetical protein
MAALAHRLVMYEASDSADPATYAAALETVCCRLRDYLTDLLGAAGFSAMMGRALSLAKREHLALAELNPGSKPSPCLAGLTQALSAESAEDAIAACNSVLAHFLGLLTELLGNDLGMQPIRKLWPELESSVMETNQ